MTAIFEFLYVAFFAAIFIGTWAFILWLCLQVAWDWFLDWSINHPPSIKEEVEELERMYRK